MNTFTLAGAFKDAKNNPLYAGEYLVWKVTSVGADTEDQVAYPRNQVDFLIDENGEFSGDMWINGDSGVECLYEIREPSGQRLKVIIPSTDEGLTVRYEYIVENYQTSDSTQQGLAKKAHFIVASSSNISISTDIDAPNLVTSYSGVDAFGFSLRASDGSMQNTTGRDIGGISGNIAMQIDNIGGGTRTLNFWSEISADGITFTPIANSLRRREVANSNESFFSTVSVTDSWPTGYWVRFVFYATGSMEFYSPNIVSDGASIDGRAILWELTEQ